MTHYKTFEYQFDDGTKTTACAVVAAHNMGKGILIEFASPKNSTMRKIKFVADARAPNSLALASSLSNEKFVAYAIQKFLAEKWGDRLSRVNVASETIHIESIVLE
ncbi:hypothetical protein [Candidatus Ferrigenium straubiae]|jgi:hypothetical protein|uniref:hypothetical protein n=1 Tax=Candidatus Ferrigenium straubiae TaxID=2919506 RepID=UPI003F4ADC27